MKPENRCLVPATSYSEHAPGKPAVPHWFALGRGPAGFRVRRPIAAALDWSARHQGGPGSWCARAVRLPDLRAERFDDAGPSQAMPFILTTPEECEAWLAAPVNEALRLQRPLPDALLSIVAKGEKQDPAPGCAKMSALLL